MTGAVEDHYARSRIIDAIRDGLAALGKDTTDLVPEDLAPIDEFHVRGRAATREMMDALAPGSADHVIDIGCGLGGASRMLADSAGCRVTGVDLTTAYCQAAAEITGWAGLSDLVSYRRGDALDLPFADATFDAAITQHVAMNIADKARLYAEARRVLKPGGTFAIYDVLQGAGGAAVFPVPWAREPSISFLVSPGEMRNLLEDAGFRIASWRDTTPEGRDWFRPVAARLRDAGPPPLGFHILLGPEFTDMAANMHRNLDDDRIVLAQIICHAG